MIRNGALHQLIQATAHLRAERIVEPSLKVSLAGMSSNRGLISMPIGVLGPDRAALLTQLCQLFGATNIAPLLPHLSAACAFHLGVDDGIGKCYLEFLPDQTPEPDLVFLALKWQDGHGATNRYHSMSALPHAAKHQAVAQHLDDPVMARVAAAMLDLARVGDPDDQAMVLRVSEDQSPRLSYDISVADAGQSLAMQRANLEPLLQAFGCAWSELPEGADATLLGHVAFGQARDGASFVTFYFGAHVA